MSSPTTSAAAARTDSHRTERLVAIVLDDDPLDRDWLSLHLSRLQAPIVDTIEAATPEKAIERLDAADIVFVDQGLGAERGVDVVRKLRSIGFSKAVILLSGTSDPDVIAGGFRAGADDYIQKERIDRESLAHSIHTALSSRSLQNQLVARTKELEQTCKHLRARNEQIRSFYQVLSHELKTPLACAIAFVEILMEGPDGTLDEEQQEHLSLVSDACDQMLVCINDLLDVARIETGRLQIRREPTDLENLLRRTAQSLRPKAEDAGLSINFSANEVGGLQPISIDGVRIAQVVSNLANNAIKFTNPGGRISVELTRAEAGLEVSVRDSGCGIAPDHLEKVFSQFFQVDDDSYREGFGLGLHICRELVQQHGGSLRVESEVGVGSRFWFTLPIEPA